MNPALPIVEELLKQAIHVEATDLHFFPSHQKTHIYFRIHGQRMYYRSIPNTQYELLLTFFKFSAGMDIGESRKPQDGSIIHHFPAIGGYSLRLSTLPLSASESLAIRMLPQKDTLSLDELFLFSNQLHTLKSYTKERAGIILITGPTGSGKTTTLYALIESLTKEHTYQTITLEDPIEKTLDEVIQVQMNEQAGITYHSGLKAALRHDPDVLMVGELRDDATAQFAFQAALTGHLVFSTLHAKNAVGTIHRLREMGIKEQDLLQSLLAVASIQLISIRQKGRKRRAAIMEFLHGERLSQVIQSKATKEVNNAHSFKHLRRKAYAYGFSPEAFSNKTKKIT